MKDQKYIDILISEMKLKDNPEGAAKVGIEKREYELSHPNLDLEENKMAARSQYRLDMIRYFFLEELQPFEGNPENIPEIPVLPVEWLRENVWPGLIRAGAVKKEDLIPGKEYLGSCRNSSKATWDGEKFQYTRYKFGESYQESIPHFQDDDGSDVFIPL